MMETKIFHDPIHGSIELHPLCVKVVDTPQFQRMRNIKQLGFCYYVYPGASHNRFEHSLGTCYLAGKMIRNIRNRQPELKITDKDVMCVEIAGLCHDLGHGPFSHLFDEEFIPRVDPGTNWKHEIASTEMLQHILEENPEVKEQFEKEKLNEKDIRFIENLINPDSKLVNNKKETDRGKDKRFLYDIVANDRNGVDVDKWDYFARDCHHLGIANGFDHRRMMKFARVLKINDETQICYREKSINNFYNMFNIRLTLHRTAYQHKIVLCINEMFIEALIEADKYICRKGTNLKDPPLNISKAKNDMKAYAQLTDSIFEEILYSSQSELEKARDILSQIHRRKLYKYIGEKHLDEEDGSTKEDIRNEIAKEEEVLREQLVICEAKLVYSRGLKDPVQNIRFYSKNSLGNNLSEFPCKLPRIVPEAFSIRVIYVFIKDESFQKIGKLQFDQWKNEK